MTGVDHKCIFDLLLKGYEAHMVPILVAVAVQYVIGFVWHGVIFARPWARAIAIDKGVKRAEYMKMRYPLWLCTLATIAANVVRTLAIYAIAQAVRASNYCMWSQAAVAVFVGTMLINNDGKFWSQRPLSLIIIEDGCQLAAGLAGAAVLFAMMK